MQRAISSFVRRAASRKFSAGITTGTSRFSGEAQAATPEGENAALGINIYKAGSDPPLLADSECPAWLWTLAEPPLTLGQLQRKANEELDIPLMERKVVLESRASIKSHNESKAKKA